MVYGGFKKGWKFGEEHASSGERTELIHVGVNREIILR